MKQLTEAESTFLLYFGLRIIVVRIERKIVSEAIRRGIATRPTTSVKYQAPLSAAAESRFGGAEGQTSGRQSAEVTTLSRSGRAYANIFV